MQEGGEMGFDEDYEVNGLDPRMWDSDNDWNQIPIYLIFIFIIVDLTINYFFLSIYYISSEISIIFIMYFKYCDSGGFILVIVSAILWYTTHSKNPLYSFFL